MCSLSLKYGIGCSKEKGVINIELIEIFREYRNGNKDIFNTLYTDGVIKDYILYRRSDLKINDKGLDCCVKGWYEDYRLPYKSAKGEKYTKFTEQVYNGSREDMKLDMLLELYKLLEDTTFCPTSNADIYSKLKYNTIKTIGANIDTSCLSESDIAYNAKGEEYSVFEIKHLENYLNFDYENNDGYCQVVTEVKEVFPNIKNILKKGADTQRKVIDLICKYYDYTHYDDGAEAYVLPPQNEMLRMFKEEYGTEISQPRYSAILSSIFDVMADCSISLKGKNIERQKFINGDYDRNKVINYNENYEDKLVAIANKMIDYKPVNVRGDKYYKFISRAVVTDMCCKCSEIISGIEHKSELNLADYGELVNAIGYVIKDNCREKFKYLCERVKSQYQNYSFITEYPIIDIAMGKHSQQLNWYLKGGKGNVQLVRYKYNKIGELIACRNTKDDMLNTVDVTDSTIIRIGRMKMLVCDKSMKIYCLSVDDEFLSVKKNEQNKFYFCKNIA